MPIATIKGETFYYEIDDLTAPWSRNVETILIEHGIVRNSQFWRHWVPALARHYRVIRRDTRGHGKSVVPPGDCQWSSDLLVRDVMGFMDALELYQVHYLGESTGGRVGGLLASLWPDRLKTLTLMSTPLKTRGHAGVPQAGPSFDVGAWVASMFESGILSAGKSQEQRDWVMRNASSVPAHVVLGIRAAGAEIDLSALVSTFTMPVLVMAATHSAVVPLTDAIEMYQMLHNGTLAVIDAPGHEIYVERPQPCIDAFLSFLAAQKQQQS
jgi:pimeloyl-ACP methyl ester carboxylesterase